MRREVTIELDGIKNRFDFVGEKDDMLHLFEVKNGPTARLRGNQLINIPKMMQFKPPFIPRGGNASYIKDFTVGQIYNGKYIIVYKKYF